MLFSFVIVAKTFERIFVNKITLGAGEILYTISSKVYTEYLYLKINKLWFFLTLDFKFKLIIFGCGVVQFFELTIEIRSIIEAGSVTYF